MKIDSRPRAILRMFAIAAALVGLVFIFGPQLSNNRDVLSAPIGQQITAGALRAGPNEPFSGPKLYREAFEALRDYHITLADSAARAKWVAEWENKFDKTADLTTEAGTDAAIAKMVESLGQRFDYYMTPEATQGNQQRQNSEIFGIGITPSLTNWQALIDGLKAKYPDGITRQQFEDAQVISDQHQFKVEEVVPDGPSAKLLKTGDIITHINGEALNGKKLSDVVGMVRGEDGTEVTLTISRTTDGKAETLTVKVKRGKVVIKVVRSKDLGDGITYVRLDNFMSQYGADEMYKALEAAGKGKGLILDLRGNPGGELNSALAMTSFMLPQGTIVVLENRDPGKEMSETEFIVAREFIMRIEAGKPQMGERPPLLIPPTMPIVVLVDGGSASASELMAGALKVHNRAVIVGQPTVGKGVGQLYMPLSFGRTIAVTSFEFLPGGTAMDWIGVIPDVTVEPDQTGATDTQLDAATKQIREMITKTDAETKRAKELEEQNKREFDEELQKRNQTRSQALQGITGPR